MAIRTAIKEAQHDLGFTYLWEGLLQGDSTKELGTAGHNDRSVQVTGTFGGATVKIEGNNGGSTWFSLTDTSGDAIELTTAGLKQIIEATLNIRATITGGDGTTNIDVRLYVVLK